jgi:hypothetical protein
MTEVYRHPCFADRWNEYTDREYVGHLLDPAHFNAMLDCDKYGRALHSVDSLGAGCLDALGHIPFGSALLVHTIGGWDREEYNRRDRESFSTSEARVLQSEREVANMLKEILEEAKT